MRVCFITTISVGDAPDKTIVFEGWAMAISYISKLTGIDKQMFLDIEPLYEIVPKREGVTFSGQGIHVNLKIAALRKN
jgi:hypothetical protein